MGGRFFVFAIGEDLALVPAEAAFSVAEDGGSAPFIVAASPAEGGGPSPLMVCVFDDTLYNDELLLCMLVLGPLDISDVAELIVALSLSFSVLVS